MGLELEASNKRWWIVAIIILVGASSLAYSVTLFDVQIDLINDSQKSTLVANCKSNGDDIGTLTIPATRKNYFLSHVLVRERSYATCSMTLGNLALGASPLSGSAILNFFAHLQCMTSLLLLVQPNVFAAVN